MDTGLAHRCQRGDLAAVSTAKASCSTTWNWPRHPDSEIRLFGKPVSYLRRRMGVALAHAADIDQARSNARPGDRETPAPLSDAIYRARQILRRTDQTA